MADLKKGGATSSDALEYPLNPFSVPCGFLANAARWLQDNITYRDDLLRQNPWTEEDEKQTY